MTEEKTDFDLRTSQRLLKLWRVLNEKDSWSFSAHDLRDKFAELFPYIAQKKIRPQKFEGNRTNMIHFSRQLKPQPPADSRPYWWGIGTLSFKDKGCKTVWEQEIPEAGSYFQLPETYRWLDVPRYFFHGCSVEFDPQWGWILNFYVAHEEAAKMWAILFKDHPTIRSMWDKERGQYFEPILIEQNKQSPEIVKPQHIPKAENHALTDDANVCNRSTKQTEGQQLRDNSVCFSQDETGKVKQV